MKKKESKIHWKKLSICFQLKCHTRVGHRYFWFLVNKNKKKKNFLLLFSVCPRNLICNNKLLRTMVLFFFPFRSSSITISTSFTWFPYCFSPSFWQGLWVTLDKSIKPCRVKRKYVTKKSHAFIKSILCEKKKTYLCDRKFSFFSAFSSRLDSIFVMIVH